LLKNNLGVRSVHNSPFESLKLSLLKKAKTLRSEIQSVANAFLYFPFGLFLPYAPDQLFSLFERHISSRNGQPFLVTIATPFLLSLTIES